MKNPDIPTKMQYPRVNGLPVNSKPSLGIPPSTQAWLAGI